MVDQNPFRAISDHFELYPVLKYNYSSRIIVYEPRIIVWATDLLVSSFEPVVIGHFGAQTGRPHNRFQFSALLDMSQTFETLFQCSNQVIGSLICLLTDFKLGPVILGLYITISCSILVRFATVCLGFAILLGYVAICCYLFRFGQYLELLLLIACGSLNFGVPIDWVLLNSG